MEVSWNAGKPPFIILHQCDLRTFHELNPMSQLQPPVATTSTRPAFPHTAPFELPLEVGGTTLVKEFGLLVQVLRVLETHGVSPQVPCPWPDRVTIEVSAPKENRGIEHWVSRKCYEKTKDVILFLACMQVEWGKKILLESATCSFDGKISGQATVNILCILDWYNKWNHWSEKKVVKQRQTSNDHPNLSKKKHTVAIV